MNKYYNLCLPLYKQGDDLAYHLDRNGDNYSQAFIDLAAQYKEAANICEIIAKSLKDISSKYFIEIQADTHYISICAPKHIMSSLVEKEILVEEDFDQ